MITWGGIAVEHEVPEFVGRCEAVPVDVLGAVRCEYYDWAGQAGGAESIYASDVWVIKRDHRGNDPMGFHCADEVAHGSVAQIPMFAQKLSGHCWLMWNLWGREAFSPREAG
jgi:hypothetical protein